MKNIFLIIISLALLSFLFLKEERNSTSLKMIDKTSLKMSSTHKKNLFSNSSTHINGSSNTNHQVSDVIIVKLSDLKLTNCLIYSSTCQELKEFKRSVSSNGYYNSSLTPYHHDFQERLEENGKSIQTDLLFKALDIDNSGIYLLVIEELYRRDLSDEQKKQLLNHINQNTGDVLASSLVTAFRIGKIKRNLIMDGFISGISKNYSSALALAKRVFHIKPSFEELQAMVDKSCEYRENTDEELFNTLMSNYRRQARSLSIMGIYYCGSF